MAGERPAMNLIASKTPEGNIEFDDRSMSQGAWAAQTKRGDNYVRGKCPQCGCKIWGFCNTKDGWKIVHDDPTPEEEF